MDSDERPCPYCAETIKIEAIKCRWCAEFLDGRAPASSATQQAASTSNATAEIRDEYLKRINGTKTVTGGAAIVCPHCQKTGGVKSKSVKQKKGISGTKATAAVLTAGISMLGTGLSRKEKVTELHCKNCGVTWVA